MRPIIPTAREFFFQEQRRTAEEEAALEESFFSNLILPNGTFKTTRHRRLDDLNALAMDYLPPARPLAVMDVAVSSGVSSAEWSEALAAAGIEHRMTAGDILVNAWLITLADGLAVLVDSHGAPLQYEVGGRALRVDLQRRLRLRHFLALRKLKVAGRSVARLLRDMGPSGAIAPSATCQPVALVSRSLTHNNRIQVLEDNIAIPGRFRGEFDALRAANILNHAYFDRDTLRAMVANLAERLREGGLLIVCRTLEDETTHGSLFRRSRSGFTEVARLGNGSEVADIVLG